VLASKTKAAWVNHPVISFLHRLWAAIAAAPGSAGLPPQFTLLGKGDEASDSSNVELSP
jgi:hypothetical protein